MRDYQQEDFQRPTLKPIPPRDPEDIMGGDAEWDNRYSDFFAKGEDEDKVQSVVIPRYDGPKNTRIDRYEMSNQEIQTVEISGVPNHAQPTCIYLKQSFIFRVAKPDYAPLMDLLSRPFLLQRTYKSIVWNCPQANRNFELHPQIHARLAPYLTHNDMLWNCNQNKYQVITEKRQDLNGDHFLDYILKINIQEPLLGFQQGYALLDAKRPMNQQGMVYPLAIQDYSLTFTRFSGSDRWKRMIRNTNMFSDYLEVLQVYGPGKYSGSVHEASRPNIMIELIKEDTPSICTFSDDSSNQNNKNVSTVSMHCPVFEIYKAPVVINPSSVAHSFYDVNEARHHDERSPVMLGLDEETEVCRIQCNTSKGFPSFFAVFLEDFGRAYYDPGSLQTNMNTDLFIGGHPRIYEMQIKVFNQDFPITKTLGHQELDYLTKKNSHKTCRFYTHMAYDPIVLLRLEDLGLATETVGYPNAKRLEMEVVISQIMLPHAFSERFRGLQNAPPKITATAVFIYENHVLEGSNGNCQFLWKY